MMSSYDEMVDIKIDLRKRGFDHAFALEHEYIRCLEYNELIAPHDFEILEIHYCKTPADIKNNAIIYAIKLKHYDIKGVLFSHYQSYLGGMSLQLWRKFDYILKVMNTRSINRPQFNHLIVVRNND
jgi:hypothetical protein